MSTNVTPTITAVPSNRMSGNPAASSREIPSTFIAALRHNGLEAPWLLAGPINGEAFLRYVSQILGPTLQPEDIVIADNLSSHKAAGARATIKARGATLLCLPAYSPDLNPIENFFAKLKTPLRKAAQRNFDSLPQAIAHVLHTLPAQECSNHFQAAGYVNA